MATSPDYLRLAASTARALADVALDSLRDAVVVVDARHKHLPVVFANASARRSLSSANADGLVESSLNDWLGAASVSAIEALALADRRSPAAHILEWRGAEGELSVFTDIRPLPMAPAQRLVMLTFAAAAPAPAARVAIGNLPFGQLILDKDLKVTYANAVAMRADASLPGGLLGVSALELIPTSALHPSVYARALQGSQFHEDSVEIAAARGPRWFEIDVQPLQAASGIVGLVVLSIEVTERRRK